MTNNLERRIFEHKEKVVQGFTSRYTLNELVYFAVTNDVREAIAREKQIKGSTRAKKIALIEDMNPCWEDLAVAWYANANQSDAEDDSSLRSE
jgi:putative endonuclease